MPARIESMKSVVDPAWSDVQKNSEKDIRKGAIVKIISPPLAQRGAGPATARLAAQPVFGTEIAKDIRGMVCLSFGKEEVVRY